MPDDAKDIGSLASAPASVNGIAVILAALHRVMGRCGYVQKKGENTFQKYRYAGEGNLLEVLRPALFEEGLLLIPSGKTRSPIDEHGITHVEVEYTLCHKDGHVWPEKIIAYGDGGDKNSKGVGDKGLYKALTGANKYLLFKLFQIETGDDPEKDAEHDKPAKAPPADETPKSPPGISAVKNEVREAIREINACDDEDSFKAYMMTKEARALAVKVCGTFRQEWAGEEEFSGLRGAIERAGKELGLVSWTENWLTTAETKAKEK